MPPSPKTFRDEYDNLSSIPRIFAEYTAMADEFTDSERLFYPASTEAALGEEALWELQQTDEEGINSNDWSRGEFDRLEEDGQVSLYPRPR